MAVIRPDIRTRTLPTWLRDSKLLAEDRRESVFAEVARWCADGAVGHADAWECDRWGMTAALRLAAYRALAALELAPDALLIDGPYNLLRAPSVAFQPELALGDGSGRARPLDAGPVPLPEVELPGTVVPVVDGDALCAAVAAASVLAKVVRDRIMRQESVHFPAYHFERNKGYPSPLHQIGPARLRPLGHPPAQLGLRRRPSLALSRPTEAGPRRPGEGEIPWSWLEWRR